MSNWRHDLGRFKDFIDETTKICFIANPNNPTGTYNTHDEVKKFLDETPKSVLVVLDLAYFEYVEKNDYVRVNELLSEFNNLLVTRTFSKIQGLASLRIGYGIASEELIEVLNRIRQPFNSNYIAQEAATIAISDKEHISKSVSLNKRERKRIQKELEGLAMKCIDSEGNFISFKGKFNSEKLFKDLMKNGVIVRPIALYDMPDYLRVTVGTEEENNFFIDVLKGLIK